jgi:hypothetical protein
VSASVNKITFSKVCGNEEYKLKVLKDFVEMKNDEDGIILVEISAIGEIGKIIHEFFEDKIDENQTVKNGQSITLDQTDEINGSTSYKFRGISSLNTFESEFEPVYKFTIILEEA